jgi:excisionase family DNA binding protein
MGNMALCLTIPNNTEQYLLMPTKGGKKARRRTGARSARAAEILDVRLAAELLTVSPDTVYELFKSGDLPGRKVGRKWITTTSAVLRWVEGSFNQMQRRALSQRATMTHWSGLSGLHRCGPNVRLMCSSYGI